MNPLLNPLLISSGGVGGLAHDDALGESWGIVEGVVNSQRVLVTVSTGVINYSMDDGKTWRIANTPGLPSNSNEFTGLAFGLTGGLDPVFVAVLSPKTIMRSTNGVDWTTNASAISDSVSASYGVSFVNNRFVFFGSKVAIPQTPLLISSTDGLTWTSHSMTGLDSWESISSVAYGAGRYVVSSRLGVHSSTSLDGSWDSTNHPTYLSSGSPFPYTRSALAFTGTAFVSVYSGSAGNDTPCLRSTNGTSWTQVSMNITGSGPQQICYSTSLSALVGIGVSYSHVSTDHGLTWVHHSDTQPKSRICTSQGPNKLFTAGALGFITKSNDAVTWLPIRGVPTTRPVGSYSAMCVTTNGNLILASQVGAFRSSDNGNLWISCFGTQEYSSVATSDIQDVCAGSNGSVVASRSATLGVSNDNGLTWTSKAGPVPGGATKVVIAFGNSTFLALSLTNGTAIRSIDNGVTWTAPYSIGVSDIADVKFLNGSFRLITKTGPTWSSADAITWTNTSSATVPYQFRIQHTSGVYVITGSSPFVRFSYNFATWTTVDLSALSPAFNYLFFYTSGPKFISPTSYGQVYTSTNAVHWTLEMNNPGGAGSNQISTQAVTAAAEKDGIYVYAAPRFIYRRRAP